MLHSLHVLVRVEAGAKRGKNPCCRNMVRWGTTSYFLVKGDLLPKPGLIVKVRPSPESVHLDPSQFFMP